MQTQWAGTPFFIAASLLAAGAARGQRHSKWPGASELTPLESLAAQSWL